MESTSLVIAEKTIAPKCIVCELCRTSSKEIANAVRSKVLEENRFMWVCIIKLCDEYVIDITNEWNLALPKERVEKIRESIACLISDNDPTKQIVNDVVIKTICS